jgi:CRP-like cAMP-binding protein
VNAAAADYSRSHDTESWRDRNIMARRRRWRSFPANSQATLSGAATDFLREQLCRRLAQQCGLPLAGLRALLKPAKARCISAGETWAGSPHPGTQPAIILSGWGCEHRILECGRRQIYSFLVPGDLLSAAKADIGSLTPMVVLDVSQLFRAAAAQGSLAQLLNDMATRQTAYLYRHIVRLGTQNAIDRTYDLLQELFQRLRQSGLRGPTVAFPLTQEILADMLGMTPVHINRVLQHMRREGCLVVGRGRLAVYPRRSTPPAMKSRIKLTTDKEAPRTEVAHLSISGE